MSPIDEGARPPITYLGEQPVSLFGWALMSAPYTLPTMGAKQDVVVADGPSRQTA